ncbi:hypothetical protein [Botrimarina sp.]|uniref:hypothetical protein n=1 Tax=Botrimarina sp. TaxID=2795802 RepID=UPI0032EDA48A
MPYFNDYDDPGDIAEFSFTTEPDPDGDEILADWQFNDPPDVPLGILRMFNEASNNETAATVPVLNGGTQDILTTSVFQVKNSIFTGQTSVGIHARATGPGFHDAANGESFYYFDTEIRDGRVRIRKVTPDGQGGLNDQELLRRVFNGNDDAFIPEEEQAGAYDFQIDDPDLGDPRPGGEFRDITMSLLVEDILVDGAPAVQLTGTIEAYARAADENGDVFNPPDAPPELITDTFTVIDMGDPITGNYFGYRTRGGSSRPQDAYTIDFQSLAIEAVTGPPVPGDFNEDGLVNAADYTVWRDNLGSETALPNDNDLGTPVGQQHYDLWAGAYGGDSGAAATAAPEPTTVGLCLAPFAIAALSHKRR